jgi:hypothetical protein
MIKPHSASTIHGVTNDKTIIITHANFLDGPGDSKISMRLRSRTFIEALLVYVITLAAYGYFTSLSDPNTNSRLALVKSFIEENRPQIDTYVSGDFSSIDVAFHNGHYYSDKPIGPSLIGIAFYYPIHWFYNGMNELPVDTFKDLLTFLAISLPCAFLAPFLYLMVKSVSGSSFKSLLIVLSICLGTPFYKFSTAYYGHAIAGVLFFTIFFLWFQARRTKQISPGRVLLSGFLTGFMVITEIQTSILVVGVGLYILYVMKELNLIREWKIYALLGAGALIPASVYLYYNYLSFGSMFSLGYSNLSHGYFQESQSQGVFGIGPPDIDVVFYSTFHPTMGIFWQSPVLLLSLLGMIYMIRMPEFRAELLLSFSIIVVYIFFMSGFYMWWGGWSPTPRYLIPVLPLFGLPLAFLPKPFTPFILIAGFLSIGQMAIIVAGDSEGIGKFLKHALGDGKYFISYKGSIIYKVYWPNLLHRIMTHNRGDQFFGLEGWKGILPLIALEVSLIGLFLGLGLRRERSATDSGAASQVS